jgi:aspartyl protease family protein
MTTWAALFILALGAMMLVSNDSGMIAGIDSTTFGYAAFFLVTLYAYKDQLTPIAARVVGELMPGTAMTVETSSGGLTEVKIRRRLNGHFTANVDVNGKEISMIVDTGASSIVLTPKDARRAGIDPNKLTYRVPVLTANGRTVAARVRLKDVSIGPLDRKSVEALVARPNALTQSLLGMSFLGRLRSYEFSGDFLTLRG